VLVDDAAGNVRQVDDIFAANVGVDAASKLWWQESEE